MILPSATVMCDGPWRADEPCPAEFTTEPAGGRIDSVAAGAQLVAGVESQLAGRGWALDKRDGKTLTLCPLHHSEENPMSSTEPTWPSGEIDERAPERGPKPTIGRIVIYTSKIENGEGNEVRSPAVVIRTRDTTVPEVVDRWGPEPTELEAVDGTTHTTAPRPDGVANELPDDHTVDLLVHGLGKDYREYSVRYDPSGTLGTWAWPVRA